jgi:uncharacterized glyoxalase superfamily protein PhnB
MAGLADWGEAVIVFRRPDDASFPLQMTSQSSSASAAAPHPANTLEADSLSASLTVRDLRASIAWYRDVVGFTLDREMVRDGVLRAAAMRAGAVRILLNQDDGAKGFERTTGLGFSLTVSTRQSVDVIADRIRSHGGTLDSEPADMPWGARVFRVRDPDGYALAFSRPLG